jgi:hypothetical protein
MLTVAQLVALQTQNFTPPLHAHDLFNTFPAAKALSLRSLINGVEQQKYGYFVEFRSLSVLQNASSFDDFMSQWNAGTGKLQTSDIVAFGNNVLQPRGVGLKLVTSDSHGFVFGPVASLTNVPTFPINPISFDDTQAQFDTGSSNIAFGGLAIGGLLVSFSPGGGIGLVVGAGIVGASAGWLVGLGISQTLEGSKPSGTSSQSDGGTSSTDQIDTTQPDGELVSLPAAEVFGDFPEQVNVEQLAESVANNVSAIPDSFDGGDGGDGGSGGDGGDGGSGGVGFA